MIFLTFYDRPKVLSIIHRDICHRPFWFNGTDPLRYRIYDSPNGINEQYNNGAL